MILHGIKCRSQVINQTATNNLNYLIDPTFNNVNRLFVLDFENEEDILSFSKYYTPTVETKDYNVILDDKEPFYEIPIRNKEETYKAITELIKDGDYTTGRLLDYEYFTKHCKLIAIDWSKQRPDLENQEKSEFENQQINFNKPRIFTKFFAYCIKMEPQKNINPLEQTDSEDLNFKQKNGISLMIKTILSMVKGIYYK